MKENILKKLSVLAHRHEEIGVLLTEAEIIQNKNRFRDLSREYAQLEEIVSCFHRYEKIMLDIHEAKQMEADNDPSLRELAILERQSLEDEQTTLEKSLELLLLPKDPNDERNIFLEVRAGTGGDEAAIFAGDLFRMYHRYAESQRWQVEILSESFGEHGGYKEIIARIIGKGAYSRLKFESGAHRVQRVPETEAQGRVHTSACTVAVLPEADEIDAVDINPNDLRVDTYRASGAGGQHVNKTDSAIRITHIPTGVVVECQDERSQHKNRARAMSLLKSRLLAAEQEKQFKERAETRKSLVGSGDRSERIRTYNFPQRRLTDHRINYTSYQLPETMEGALDECLQALQQEHQAELLAQSARELN